MIYATQTDLVAHGMPATAFGALTSAQKDAALEAASRVVDGYLRGRYALPLLAWGVEITQWTCEIAAYHLLNIRGYNPASGADVNVLARYQDTILKLRDVQRGALHPELTPAVADVTHEQPHVISSSPIAVGSACRGANRGW